VACGVWSVECGLWSVECGVCSAVRGLAFWGHSTRKRAGRHEPKRGQTCTSKRCPSSLPSPSCPRPLISRASGSRLISRPSRSRLKSRPPPCALLSAAGSPKAFMCVPCRTALVPDALVPQCLSATPHCQSLRPHARALLPGNGRDGLRAEAAPRAAAEARVKGASVRKNASSATAIRRHSASAPPPPPPLCSPPPPLSPPGPCTCAAAVSPAAPAK